jgi:hypothetical protein
MDSNDPTTKLLTLLNVSAAKSLKPKLIHQLSPPPQKLNKKRRVNSVDAESGITAHEVLDARKDDGGGDKTMAVSEAADLSDIEGTFQGGQGNAHLT